MQIVYFARVREAIGIDGEQRDWPANVLTIADCLSWLVQQGDQYGTAFAEPDKLRFALDQHMVDAETLLKGATELAIFPPVTGG